MKKFFKENKSSIFFIIIVLCVWRVFLFIPYFLGNILLAQRSGYIGPSVWANFDGVHYLSIAQSGYFQFEQAFFPLFPLLIKYTSYVTFGNYLIAGFFIVHLFLFFFLFLFYKLLLEDYKEYTVRWIIIFTLFFPTSFFLGAIYTETLFLFLVIAAFYTARKEKWYLTAVCIGLASATKLIGIFLLPVLLLSFYLQYKKHIFLKRHILKLISLVVIGSFGLVSYMVYLWQAYKDPLFFIHAQPAFGANRTGGTLIFLPQVLFRYIKIFLTVSFSQYDTWIALLEFSMFLFFIGLLLFGLFKRYKYPSYYLFALMAIVGPTLTGSLSSMPRYVLIGFPIFIILGSIRQIYIKVIILILSTILLIILSMYYLRGYFIG